jgi:hypothetical protein
MCYDREMSRKRQIRKVAIITKTQNQCQNVKILGTNIKVLSQGAHIRKIKVLSLNVQKIWTMLKF